MFSFLQDAGNYEQRKVAKDELENGVVVSTVDTSDEGYETALLDKEDVHPVERYESRESAETGHRKWLEFAKTVKNGTLIKKLGWQGLVDSKDVTLSL